MMKWRHVIVFVSASLMLWVLPTAEVLADTTVMGKIKTSAMKGLDSLIVEADRGGVPLDSNPARPVHPDSSGVYSFSITGGDPISVLVFDDQKRLVPIASATNQPAPDGGTITQDFELQSVSEYLKRNGRDKLIQHLEGLTKKLAKRPVDDPAKKHVAAMLKDIKSK